MSILPFSFPDHIFPSVAEPFPGLPLSPKEKIEKLTSKYHELVKQFDDYEYAEFLKSQSENNFTNTAAKNIDSNILDSPPRDKQDNNESLNTATNDNDVVSIASSNYSNLSKDQSSEQKSCHENDETTDTQQEPTDTSNPTLTITKNLAGTEIEHPVAEDMALNINSSKRLTATNLTLNKLSRSLTVKIQKAESGSSKKSSAILNDAANSTVDPLDVDDLFKWARETVDFAESQIGLASEIVMAAIEVILLVSESQRGVTRFKGAALYIVGVWTLFGQFRRKVDPKKAFDLFHSSAKHGFVRAFYRIGSEFEKVGDVTNALHFFNLGVQRNDSACLYRLAMCFLKGQLGHRVNIETGRHFLKAASKHSDPDCPQSSYLLGLIQLGEVQDIAPPDPSLPNSFGIAAMERAAWLGYGPALLRMGMSWQGGEKGYDSSIALRYFHITSRQQQYLRYKGDNSAGLGGCAEAEISKWMICGSEGMFEPNEEYAFYFAKLASELSNPIAEFAVGYFYEVGIYVEQDLKTALFWYNIASENGSKEAGERLQELKLDRKNTITKQQHRRQVTIKGRGSIKSYKRKPSGGASETATQEEVYPESSSSFATDLPQRQKRSVTEHFGVKNINPPNELIPSMPDSIKERTRRSTSFFTPPQAWEPTFRETSTSPACNGKIPDLRSTPSPVILNEPLPSSSSPNLVQYNRSSVKMDSGSTANLSLKNDDTPVVTLNGDSAATTPVPPTSKNLVVPKRARKKRFSLVGLFSTKEDEKENTEKVNQEVKKAEQGFKSMIIDDEPRSKSVSPKPSAHLQYSLELPPNLSQQRASPSPKPYDRVSVSPRPLSQNSGHTFTMGSTTSGMSVNTDQTSSTSFRSDSPFQRPKSYVTVIQAAPSSKGAKTFEEMGIPLQPNKQKEDCIIM
jgi:TPR repeat protein